LLRGLRVLEKQERNANLKEIIDQLGTSIEGGSTFSEALAQHPKVFNRLFVNMVKAGELGGVLEVVLNRLAEFTEKAEKIKGKVIAAMFYPTAVMTVAMGILALLMVVVVPKFKQIFADLLGDGQMPAFTDFVLAISDAIKSKTVLIGDAAPFGLGIFPGPVIWGIVAFVICFKLALRTKKGRWLWDKATLHFPVIGGVVSKVAIARFCRTLGTLVSSGVPILQALNIVRETAGNVVVANAVQMVHESVKEGETITAPLEKSGVFPPMVISMVDVGEQTGALPEMLLKIADTYDDEVDNAVAAMTSLLEPVMIVFLAVIVGSIVIALFLPLITLIDKLGGDGGGPGE
jgi:type IV pilus assembly protein PilC